MYYGVYFLSLISDSEPVLSSKYTSSLYKHASGTKQLFMIYP